MTYLLLAILCTVTISSLMRVLDPFIKNNMTMFTANYIACSVCAVFFLFKDSGADVLKTAVTSPGLGFAVGLGLISGVLYLVSFLLMQLNIQKNGVILTSVFGKLGVIVPVFMAMIFFHETPGVLQIIGFVLAITAILFMNGGNKDSAGSIALLVIMLLVGGITDSTTNIYDKLGNSDLRNVFLTGIFFAAILVSVIGILVKKQKVTWKDFGCGVIIGIPNYFSARFMLYALATVPAVVAYPVYNVAAILIITLIGLLFFKEKLQKRKIVGLLLIVGAIIMEVL